MAVCQLVILLCFMKPVTLIDRLSSQFPDSSKTTLRSWIKDGRVTVDGKVAKKASTEIHTDQKVALGARIRFVGNGVRLIYEDSNIVIIDKPTGLLSVSTAFEKKETAHAVLKDSFRPKKVFVVHRLDQDTSGVMAFALDEYTYEKLKEDFEKHLIQRQYIAVVERKMEESEGTWQSYLFEDANYVVHSTSDPKKGTLAITHYECIARSSRYSMLRLTLETGKKNQIRVHCQDAGHSVVGDKKYGARSNPLKRLGLHAELLAFRHPVTKKEMRFESEVPEIFDDLF